MSIKTKSIGALFLALVVILVVRPQIINNIYSSILGRVVLLGILIFFSMNNVTLGLLVALAIIAALNQYSPFVEGMESRNSRTVGDDTTTTTTDGNQTVSANAQAKKDQIASQITAKISELKTQAQEAGIDKQVIQDAIASKDSSTIPVNSNSSSSEEVKASSPGTLRNNSTLTEGFSSCAAAF